jgi:hypothetical protein
MRSIAFAIAVGSVALFTSASAGAFTLPPLEGATAADSSLLLVRDGCGRGFRYSYRAGVRAAAGLCRASADLPPAAAGHGPSRLPPGTALEQPFRRLRLDLT